MFERWMKIIMAILVNTDFETLRDKCGVSVHGFTGVGKSMFVQIMQGANYWYNKATRRYEQISSSGKIGPSVGSQAESKTISISAYVGHDGRFFFDMAGMGDTRGEPYEMWAQFMLSTFYRVVGGIQATVIVIDASSICSKRGGDLRKLAMSLAKTFGTDGRAKPFYESMCFVFTRLPSHPGPDGEKFTTDDVKNEINEVKKVESKRLERLQREHERSSSSRRADTCKEGPEDDADAEKNTDSEDLDAERKKKKELEEEITECFATLHLIKAILENDACIVSNPVDAHACDTLRKDMTELLKKQQQKSKLKTKDQLQDAVQGMKFRALETRDMLAKLANEHVERLRAYAENMEETLKIAKKKAENIDEENYKDVLASRVSQVQAKLTEKKSAKELKKKEIDELMNLTENKTFHEYEVRGIHSWFFGWFRSATAPVDFNKGKDYYFTKLAYEGDNWERTEGTSPSINGKEGVYRDSLTSRPGTDLNVTVFFQRPENESPPNIDRRSLLNREVNTLKSDITILLEEQEILAKCVSFKKFADYLLKSAHVYEENLRELKLNETRKVSLGNQDVTFTLRQVLQKLCAASKVLSEAGVLEKGFMDSGEAASKSLTDFISAHENAERVREKCEKDELCKQFFKNAGSDSVLNPAGDVRSIDQATEPPSFYNTTVPRYLKVTWEILFSEKGFLKNRDAFVAFIVLVTILSITVFGPGLQGLLCIWCVYKIIDTLCVKISSDKIRIVNFFSRLIEWAQVHSVCMPEHMFNGLRRSLDKFLERMFPTRLQDPTANKSSIFGTLLDILQMLVKKFV
jgi:hypothetical protein